MDMKYLRSILVVLSVLGWISTSSAQVSGDPSDPTAIGFSKKKTNVSPWIFAGSTSAVRGLDYFDKVFLSYSASAIYRLKHKQMLSANLSYSAPADGNVTFTEDWGFEDISFNYTKRGIFKLHKKTNTSLRLGLGLPTSETSQRASLKGSVSASLPTSLRWKGNTFVVSPGLGASAHKYETANDAGTRQNSPFSMRLNLVASRVLYKRVSGAVTAGYVNLADYDFSFRQIQSLGFNLTVPIYKKTNLTGGYSWRDTVISHNAAFDDDRSRYFLSLSVVL